MKINILDVQIDSITLTEVLQKIQEFLKSRHQHFIVTPNPEFIVAAQTDAEFKKILNYADIAVPDGAGIMLAAWLAGSPLKARITGNDLVWKLAKLSEQKNCTLYFLGGQNDVAKIAVQEIKKIHPDCKIAGAESGGVIDPKNPNPALMARINRAKPDILLIALGQIKQEKFIYYNLDKLPSVKIAVGVGGVFDYISGTVPRAPKWLRQIGLEWLYRLISQPARWRRIYNAVIVFPWIVIKKRTNR